MCWHPHRWACVGSRFVVVYMLYICNIKNKSILCRDNTTWQTGIAWNLRKICFDGFTTVLIVFAKELSVAWLMCTWETGVEIWGQYFFVACMVCQDNTTEVFREELSHATWQTSIGTWERDVWMVSWLELAVLEFCIRRHWRRWHE